MNIVKYVFAQLVTFLDRSKFNRTIAKYTGDAHVKFFTCWNQLLVMMFGQLTNREGSRDLVVALEAHHGKTPLVDLFKKSNFKNVNERCGSCEPSLFDNFNF